MRPVVSDCGGLQGNHSLEKELVFLNPLEEGGGDLSA